MASVPWVSVVVSTFNGERFVADTLRSVLAQRQPGLELLVVDDGSSDSTLAQVAATAPQACVLRQANAGVSVARNHGLRMATGRYVIFLDQDDIWHPQMLERQVAWLEAHEDHDVAVCRYQHWWPAPEGHDASPPEAWPAVQDGIDPEFSGWVYHQFLRDCWALTSGTLMRRAVVAAAGGFDTALAYGEDWELWLRLSQDSRFALLQWPPVLYRQHPVQGSRQLRVRDHRCELLEAAVRRWGYASRDGRDTPKREHDAILARYRAEFGRHHLVHGNLRIGARHLLLAWWSQQQWRYLAQAGLALLGWRPRA